MRASITSAATVTSLCDRLKFVSLAVGQVVTLQSVRGCQQVFSSALIANVESAYPDDTARNELCEPVRHPDAPLDWLRIARSDNRAPLRWLRGPAMAAWLESARLNILRGLFANIPAAPAVRERVLGMMAAAMEHTNQWLTALMAESSTRNTSPTTPTPVSTA